MHPSHLGCRRVLRASDGELYTVLAESTGRQAVFLKIWRSLRILGLRVRRLCSTAPQVLSSCDGRRRHRAARSPGWLRPAARTRCPRGGGHSRGSGARARAPRRAQTQHPAHSRATLFRVGSFCESRGEDTTRRARPCSRSQRKTSMQAARAAPQVLGSPLLHQQRPVARPPAHARPHPYRADRTDGRRGARRAGGVDPGAAHFVRAHALASATLAYVGDVSRSRYVPVKHSPCEPA